MVEKDKGRLSTYSWDNSKASFGIMVHRVVKFRKELEKNIWGKNQKKEEWKDIDIARNNILLPRLSKPRHVQLPNSRIFFAKHERINRHALASTQVRTA